MLIINALSDPWRTDRFRADDRFRAGRGAVVRFHPNPSLKSVNQMVRLGKNAPPDGGFESDNRDKTGQAFPGFV